MVRQQLRKMGVQVTYDAIRKYTKDKLDKNVDVEAVCVVELKRPPRKEDINRLVKRGMLQSTNDPKTFLDTGKELIFKIYRSYMKQSARLIMNKDLTASEKKLLEGLIRDQDSNGWAKTMPAWQKVFPALHYRSAVLTGLHVKGHICERKPGSVHLAEIYRRAASSPDVKPAKKSAAKKANKRVCRKPSPTREALLQALIANQDRDGNVDNLYELWRATFPSMSYQSPAFDHLLKTGDLERRERGSVRLAEKHRRPALPLSVKPAPVAKPPAAPKVRTPKPEPKTQEPTESEQLKYMEITLRVLEHINSNMKQVDLSGKLVWRFSDPEKRFSELFPMMDEDQIAELIELLVQKKVFSEHPEKSKPNGRNIFIYSVDIQHLAEELNCVKESIARIEAKKPIGTRLREKLERETETLKAERNALNDRLADVSHQLLQKERLLETVKNCSDLDALVEIAKKI